MAFRTHLLAALLGLSACGGSDWVAEMPESPKVGAGEDAWKGAGANDAAPQATATARARDVMQGDRVVPSDPAEAPLSVRLVGVGAGAGDGGGDDLSRNTYYDFPREGAGNRSATVYDAACAPIAKVTQAFHDQVCVQGSGRLASGATVSFAKRGCECAAVCPRTGQKICFERLDPALFPHGRGAAGRAITPLRTVAVDTAVIPLGTWLRIPELAGLPRPDGSLHDGCFLAEDRGIKVVGRQIDVFTGDPAVTARWNSLFPSNRGVHVRRNDPACKPAGG